MHEKSFISPRADTVPDSRDQLLRITLADAGLLSANPVSEISCLEVPGNVLAAGLSLIVINARVGAHLPQLCR